MVATAASPVGTDAVRLEILVGEGARLAVRSMAAGIAWSGTGSRQHVVADVGTGATLDWAPEPLIVTGRCNHRVDASITVAPGATLWWTERIVLGRHGEMPGSLSTRLTVDVGDQPLLRHRLDIGARAPAWSGPAVLRGARAVGLLLAVGPEPAGVRQRGAGWAAMPLDGPASLGMAVAGNATEMERAMESMRSVLAPRSAVAH